MRPVSSSHPPPRSDGPRSKLHLIGKTLATTTLFVCVGVGAALAAAPAPCNNVPQITDATGDGHHPATDVLSAWFSEADGRLQGVIRIRSAEWKPEHDDAEINGSGYPLLFTVGGTTRFVRANAAPSGALTYDYGTYTRAGGFVKTGATTGSVAYGFGGTVTIDVPPFTGATAGTALTNPFVLTYDGITAGDPDWVDHAPGGTSPDDTSFGADYVVGSCGAGAGAGTPGAGAPGRTTAVQLSAPAKLKKSGKATVKGRVLPARAGVVVSVTRKRYRRSATSKVRTGADGRFSIKVPFAERTKLRASAEGIRSQELTVKMRSSVKLSFRRLRSGGTKVSLRGSPALPGRLLLLRTNEVRPTSKKVSRGRVTLRFKKRLRGRFQAVYIPSSARAERSTSKTGATR